MDNLKKVGIIPARFASTRFPGKPLIDIGGKSMIRRVYEQARKSNLDDVYVATDDSRIQEHVIDFGGNVVMTSPDISSGTERCLACLRMLENQPEWIVNIQGDEPFIDPDHINSVLKLLENGADIATLISPAVSKEEIENPNRVKVVRSLNGKALYFSRSPIPFDRKGVDGINGYYIHLGIYGFNVETLSAITESEPSYLEKTEMLEQLRWLEMGYDIYTEKVLDRADSVDTPEDLLLIEKKYFL